MDEANGNTDQKEKPGIRVEADRDLHEDYVSTENG